MRNFKLIVKTNRFQRTITTYDSQSQDLFHEPYSTFNEKLTESENDQFQLTFSIAGWVNDHGSFRKNYWLDLIKIGSQLVLTIDDDFEVRLIVSKVNPIPSPHNLIYNFTADDEVSYLWSRHNLGYGYSNIEVKENGSITGVQNIYEIVNQVLADNYLNEQWTCKDTEPESVVSKIVDKLISLEVLDSNPYNVIIEACNTIGCYLRVNYKEQYLTFYQKNTIPFSGYRYRPDTNTASFSVNYDSNEFATIMHGVGGENEYGEIITLVPAVPQSIMNWLMNNKSEWISNGKAYNLNLWYHSDLATLAEASSEEARNEIQNFIQIAKEIPHLGQFLSNFDYFQKAGLINNDDYTTLTNTINLDMRNNNIYLKYYVPLRYELQWSVNSAISYIENIATNFYGAELNITFDDTYATYTINSQTEADKYSNDISLYIDNKIIFSNLDSIYGLKGKQFTNIKNNVNEIKTLAQKLSDYQTKIDNLQKTYRKLLNTMFTYELYTNNNGATQKYNDSYQIALRRLTTLEEKTNPSDIDSSNITILRDLITPNRGELANTKDKIITLAALVGNDSVDGAYAKLLELLEEKYIAFTKKVNENDSYNAIIKKYEDANKLLWQFLYKNYGQFIYEQQYENTDELDSVSLYNQTITYFEKQKRPIASYTIEVLDIGALELIDLPRLSIGSKIRVYNDKLNLTDAQYDDQGELTRAEDIISFNNNDLITTQITTDLRNPTKIQVGVEQVQPYSAIISKLLQSVRY